MTSDAPARRLLAGLVDEQAIEAESIAEVRADLAALGLDPARAVALARRLAAGTASPAVALLGKIADAEADDDEIRRLEQVDLAAVRQRLDAGSAAAAVAQAQRAAGSEPKVVPLRRRRSRRLLYGLSGVAAALAASLVLIVGLSPHRLAYRPLTQEPGLPTTIIASSPATNATDSLQARMRPAGSGSALPAEQQASAPAAPQPAADAEVAARAKSEADESTVTSVVDLRERQLADAPAQTVGSVSTSTAGQSASEEMRGDALANRIASQFGLDRPVTALLIVDPKLVPADLKQENYPAGDLLARLGDARRLAGDRPIAALVTLQLADRIADAVVIAGAADHGLALRRDLDKTAATTALPVTAGAGYDVLLLDRR